MQANSVLTPIDLRNLFTGSPPACGIHTRVPFDEYLEWEAVNHSLIKHVARSPRHALEEIREQNGGDDAEETSTEAQAFGTMFHTALLEPDRYEALKVWAPTNPKTGKSYGVETKAYADAAAEQPGKLLVPVEWQDRINDMIDAIKAHPRARRLVAAPGQVEVAAVWMQAVDDMYAIRCKARIDKFVAGEFRLELKTTRDASAEAFARDAYKFGYHRAAAMYQDGFEAASGNASAGVILAVEKDPPYGVALYEFDEDALKVGRTEYRELLAQFAACARLRNWPCYCDEVMPLSLPAWALARFHDGAFGGGM